MGRYRPQNRGDSAIWPGASVTRWPFEPILPMATTTNPLLAQYWARTGSLTMTQGWSPTTLRVEWVSMYCMTSESVMPWRSVYP